MRCFFIKRLKILIVKVAEFGNPSTKNIDREREVHYYVFWSILSQMRHVCCEIFPKNLFLNLYALWWNFPCDRILHLASQTMYFGVSYLVRYFDKTPKICCYGFIASYSIPKKMFCIIWINKSMKEMTSNFNFLLKSSQGT